MRKARTQALGLAVALLLLPASGLGQTSSIDGSLSVRPFAGVPPDTVADLLAVPGALEGQITLQWTAPPVYPGGVLDSYQVRLQTFSVADVGGSSTAWWNHAAGALVQSFYGVGPGAAVTRVLGPAPADHVMALEPGVTYYLAVRSADDLGAVRDFWSDISNVSTAAALDLPPSAPTNLTAASGNTLITLSWNAVNAGDLDFYRLHVDSTSPYDFSNEFLIYADSTSVSFAHTGLTNGNTYFYFITAIDKGAPSFAGSALESPPSSIIDAAPSVPLETLPPAAVAGLSGQLTPDGNVFTIGWSAVTTNADGTPITDLSLYRVLKSTGLFAPTTAAFVVSPPQTSLADGVNGGVFYYKIRAVDASGNESMDSNSIASMPNPPVLALGNDGKTHSTIATGISAELHKANNASGSDLIIVPVRLTAEETGNILKSYRFEARRSENNRALERFSFSKPLVNVNFGFVTGGGLGALNHTDKKITIYWDRGDRLISLGGHIDYTQGDVSVLSSNLGRYQLRLISAAADMVLTDGSPYPRVITPNGDGINDRVFFFFEATDAPKDGKIYDLNGAFVGSLKPGPVQDSSLVWDGKDDRGNAAPMGVYLYKVSIGDKNATGTVVVAR